MKNEQKHAIDTADGQPRAKRQKVDDRTGSPTTIEPSDNTMNLISRPLSEPPIFCYDEHIEYVEAILKAMRERPHDFDADPATRMQALQTEIEEQIFWTYFQWSQDMAEEADRAGNSKALKFYNGLETALLVDERILNVERGNLRLESGDEWIAGSDIGSSSSTGYATAEEEFGSGTDRSEGS